jgi:hypothetical protein
MNKIKLIHKAREILDFQLSKTSLINQNVGFRAIGLMHTDWNAAANEIKTLFAGQWKNGMLPHLIFGGKNESVKDFWEMETSLFAPDTVLTSGVTQLPIYGVVLLKMYQLLENKNDAIPFLHEMYPKIHAFHQYLYTYRDDNEEGLVALIHPYESGTEDSPMWDSILDRMPVESNEAKELVGEESRGYDFMRYMDLISLYQKYNYSEEKIAKKCPIRVQDPYFNAVLSWSNEAMIEIGRILREDVTDFVLWNELTVYSMNDKLWDEEQGIYNAYDMVSETYIDGNTLSGMLAIAADVPNIDQAENILRNVKDEFFSGNAQNPIFLCPTYDVTAENIQYSKKQRGAVSIVQNWILYQGLKRFEMNAVADKVKKDSLELVSIYGFCEFFNPSKKVARVFTANTDNYENVICAAVCLDFLLEEK